MQFNGTPTGNNYSGVPSYPYNPSVDGGANHWMMCLGYNEQISGGETGQAAAASVGSLDLNTHLLDCQAKCIRRVREGQIWADNQQMLDVVPA